jgi:hypothetical protein
MMAFSRRGYFGWFVIAEDAGTKFLNALSGIIRGGEQVLPPSLQLPTFQPVGFGPPGGDDFAVDLTDGGYSYALFRDGLALLGDPFRGRPLGVATWTPNEGLR